MPEPKEIEYPVKAIQPEFNEYIVLVSVITIILLVPWKNTGLAISVIILYNTLYYLSHVSGKKHLFIVDENTITVSNNGRIKKQINRLDITYAHEEYVMLFRSPSYHKFTVYTATTKLTILSTTYDNYNELKAAILNNLAIRFKQEH